MEKRPSTQNKKLIKKKRPIEKKRLNPVSIFEPAIIYSEKISNYPLLCSSTYHRSTVSALGDSIGGIYIIDTNCTKHNFLCTDMDISTSSIFDICWYKSSTIAIASGEIDLITLDLVTTKPSRLKGHGKSIRSIKKHDSSLYTCAGDGKVISWDLRNEKPAIEMFLPKKSRNIITALDIHDQEPHLIFATSTPGTNLNIWDIRYTQRGLYISKESQNSKHITNDLFYKENFLYYLLSDGSLIRTTETGIFINNIAPPTDFDLKTGKIITDLNTDFIMAATGDRLTYINTEFPKEPRIFGISRINGLNSVFKRHFFTYDDFGTIIVYNFTNNGVPLL
ncbi:putative WD40/YVTN repeat-like-containing domain, WD40 repeat protein [Pseudoloma neurophilia]|uniref:Putative WD40/YVTN repeat-like-containing domain, WD40 repeat protein n=1 Tax=Pseudoloma neurophilia TaxID=146866 RepID=A0A0R0LUZ6_9MICR|nr:putative WD40/YVTN repeat-like-containing domain, WD40 repeat protein [Pseudoloma neurophilia]